jgi:hypothetical protein
MTPQELENIERAFDKAKMQGVQALHDWAVTNAPLLFADVQHLPPIASDDPACDAPALTRVDVVKSITTLTDALRPFAAFGSPPVLEALNMAEAALTPDAKLYVFAVAGGDDDGLLASVTREQCIAAHDLINEIDGGGGA